MTNHGYHLPEGGDEDWHIPLNENFQKLDRDVELRGQESELSSKNPTEGAKYLAVDTGVVYLGTGSEWQSIGSIAISTDEQRTAADGYVVPLGGDADGTPIDPESTQTPVQDALDAIGKDNPGTVLLPPGVVQEHSPLVRGQRKTIAGFGSMASTLSFPGEINGIEQDHDGDWGYATLRDLNLDGDGASGRALHFRDYFPAQGLDMDRIYISGWHSADPIIHFESSHTFDFHWSKVMVNGYGVPFKVDHAGTHGRIDHMLLVTYSDHPAFQVTGTYPEWSIGGIQCTNGGDSTSVYDFDIGNTGSLTIDQLKFEPMVDQRTPDAVVRKGPGSGYLSIDSIQTAAGNASVNHMFRDVGSGNWRIGAAKGAFDGAELSGSKIKVDRSPDNQAVYDGFASDVDGPGVSCLADLTITQ
jgi:hypothetical protein